MGVALGAASTAMASPLYTQTMVAPLFPKPGETTTGQTKLLQYLPIRSKKNVSWGSMPLVPPKGTKSTCNIFMYLAVSLFLSCYGPVPFPHIIENPHIYGKK